MRRAANAARVGAAATVQGLAYLLGPFTPRGYMLSTALAVRLRHGTTREDGPLDAVAQASYDVAVVAYRAAGVACKAVLPAGASSLMEAELQAWAKLWAWAHGADGALTLADVQAISDTGAEFLRAQLEQEEVQGG